MLFRKRLACSFCGRSADEVSKLVAGPRVYICDACVAAASRIIEESDRGPGPGVEPMVPDAAPDAAPLPH